LGNQRIRRYARLLDQFIGVRRPSALDGLDQPANLGLF
jgi:hypothetical protein